MICIIPQSLIEGCSPADLSLMIYVSAVGERNDSASLEPGDL